ncbi:nuclear transport factor 2 family protein [Flavobacterium cupreum]|uniref:Nuclear transport factor 2 family protein n=1 Tax=Flavobacterium cupreum TaxID=2133766 RepID=A0A434ACK7_9FLAO|nr:nuclear transport factor 2 family protein [Flavobacterium cupreum]RUT72094.1 nuclear transport factor 2 family protein [Flavobacterium cupreum]
MNTKEVEDRILLKELVDTISILGDKKDFNKQVKLFSENAVSETRAHGKTILKLEGRKVMAAAFAEYLSAIETVYHFNGQQVFTIDGDKASGTCYCLITLISSEKGQKTRTTIGAIYEDDYIRADDRWLVAKRIGTFEFQFQNQ